MTQFLLTTKQHGLPSFGTGTLKHFRKKTIKFTEINYCCQHVRRHIYPKEEEEEEERGKKSKGGIRISEDQSDKVLALYRLSDKIYFTAACKELIIAAGVVFLPQNTDSSYQSRESIRKKLIRPQLMRRSTRRES